MCRWMELNEWRTHMQRISMEQHDLCLPSRLVSIPSMSATILGLQRTFSAFGQCSEILDNIVCCSLLKSQLIFSAYRSWQFFCFLLSLDCGLCLQLLLCLLVIVILNCRQQKLLTDSSEFFTLENDICFSFGIHFLTTSHSSKIISTHTVFDDCFSFSWDTEFVGLGVSTVESNRDRDRDVSTHRDALFQIVEMSFFKMSRLRSRQKSRVIGTLGHKLGQDLSRCHFSNSQENLDCWDVVFQTFEKISTVEMSFFKQSRKSWLWRCPFSSC
jgi:hypothetical protein